MELITETLLDQVIELNNDSKYADVIKLLSDDVLTHQNNTSLYNEAGRAYSSLGNYEMAIALFNKGIELDPNNDIVYKNRGGVYGNLGQYNNAIADYTKAIELNPEFSEAYNDRGVAYVNKNEFDNAIADYNEAIKLNPGFTLAYNNRGLAYYDKKEYDKAIVDYNEVIRLDRYDTQAYNNRGLAYYDKKEYDKAIADYNEAIKLDPNYTLAYNNRGAAFEAKGDTEKALADYNTAIEKGTMDIYPYSNRGELRYGQGKYEEALKDFNKALEIDPNDTYSQYWIDRINEKKESPVIEQENALDDIISRIKKSFDRPVQKSSESPDNKSSEKSPDEPKIFQMAVDITKQYIKKIQDYATVQETTDLTHYTRLKVADIFVSNDATKLRYYNAIYMNDPEEGEVLPLYLDGAIHKAYEAGKQNEDSNIYLGSFLDGRGRHKDELVMWRTYGKDENGTEAAGCSIVINAGFFDTTSTVTSAPTSDNNDSQQATMYTKQPLYRVLYYDKQTDKFTDDTTTLAHLLKELKTKLVELIDMKDNKMGDKTQKDKTINKIVYHILSEIRYLFKSADYAYENEYRVIQYAKHTGNNKEQDDKIKVDHESTPKRLYVESNSEIQPHIKEIYLGAKVPRPEQWIYLDIVMRKKGRNITLLKSKCKFQ